MVRTPTSEGLFPYDALRSPEGPWGSNETLSSEVLSTWGSSGPVPTPRGDLHAKLQNLKEKNWVHPCSPEWGNLLIRGHAWGFVLILRVQERLSLVAPTWQAGSCKNQPTLGTELCQRNTQEKGWQWVELVKHSMMEKMQEKEMTWHSGRLWGQGTEKTFPLDSQLPRPSPPCRKVAGEASRVAGELSSQH